VDLLPVRFTGFPPFLIVQLNFGLSTDFAFSFSFGSVKRLSQKVKSPNVFSGSVQ